MRNRKYQIELITAITPVRVLNTRTGKVKQYYPGEFIYGSRDFNDEVDHYPNYIHEQLWRLMELHF